jgi:hypothetical protein
MNKEKKERSDIRKIDLATNCKTIQYLINSFATHNKLALCNILTIRLITSRSSSGTFNHKLNASMSFERISLPGIWEW